MGTRANVYIHYGTQPGVYLYQHWAGGELAETARKALDRGRDRWDDHQYLARIIFSEMIRDDIDGTIGYGISADLGDGGDRIVDVNTREQTVTLVRGGEPATPVPFTEFVKQTPAPTL